MNILLVEDNARMREMIRSVLTDVAHEVYECDDGADALAAYTLYRPDWVLMDIRMKTMDGITATRQIVAAYPEAQVMIISNYDDLELRDAAREAGAAAYLHKENLLAVRRLLETESQERSPGV